MPEVIVVDRDKPDERAIARAVAVLLRGGLVAFPTETVYGLGALALEPKALARIFAAKGRPVHHPLIAHVTGIAQAKTLIDPWPKLAHLLATAFWPGPLTLIGNRSGLVLPELTGGHPSVAVRSPAHPVALALIEAVGAPLAAPSANKYQGISPTSAAHVVASLGNEVDLVLDAGPCSEGVESTVVDIAGEAPRILRPGPLSLAMLRKVASSIVVADETADDDAMRASPGLDRRHYAPRAKLVVVESATVAVELAKQVLMRDDERVALMLWDHHPDAMAHVVRTMPARAHAYARDLYATLHELDAIGVDIIVVQQVPEGSEWDAVRDRLARAAEVPAKVLS
jgi:L-threonylcarbamoyladenylate synthase